MREARDQYGMQTFDQHLMDLVTEGVVTVETALAAAPKPADFELQIRTLRRRSRVAPPADGAKASGDDLSRFLPGQ
jgi:twitching motility protein PilT